MTMDAPTTGCIIIIFAIALFKNVLVFILSCSTVALLMVKTCHTFQRLAFGEEHLTGAAEIGRWQVAGIITGVHGGVALLLRWPGHYWLGMSLTQCNLASLAGVIALIAALVVSFFATAILYGIAGVLPDEPPAVPAVQFAEPGWVGVGEGMRRRWFVMTGTMMRSSLMAHGGPIRVNCLMETESLMATDGPMTIRSLRTIGKMMPRVMSLMAVGGNLLRSQLPGHDEGGWSGA